MTAADVGRIAVAATSATLGVHPDALVLGGALVAARAWVAAVAAWRRLHLSWPPDRPPRVARVIDGGPVGRRVPN